MKKITSVLLIISLCVFSFLPLPVGASGLKRMLKSSYFSIDTTAKTYTGKAIKPMVKSSLKKGRDYTVSYRSNINAGTATITVRGKGSYIGNISKNFTIKRKKVKNKDFNLKVKTKIYTGKAIKPKITSKINKKYFTLSYKKNINVGTAKIVINAKDNYKGKVTKTFKITKKGLTNGIISGNYGDKTYTGEKIEPAYHTKLQINKDFTVSYNNNKNVGTATVTFTGKGNYKGIIQKRFKILPKSLNWSDFELADKTYTYSGKPQNALFTTALQQDKDFNVTYSNNVNAGNATVTFSGIGNYTGTLSKNYKINQKNIVASNFTFDLSNKTYTGKSIKPSVTSSSLNSSKDFSVEYSNNINIGTATITVKGKGNYTNTVTKNFKIVKPTVGKVTGLKVTKNGKKAVLNWNKLNDATGYEIYQSTKKNSGYKKIKTISSGSTVKYTTAKLETGTYYFKVRAVKKVANVTVYGAYSAIKSIKIS